MKAMVLKRIAKVDEEPLELEDLDTPTPSGKELSLIHISEPTRPY